MTDNYWELTQSLLQGDTPLVKKPKLTENLLRKPPFRFLHDVISEVQGSLQNIKLMILPQLEDCSTMPAQVQRNTDYANELYSCAELDAKGIQVCSSRLQVGRDQTAASVRSCCLAGQRREDGLLAKDHRPCQCQPWCSC